MFTDGKTGWTELCPSVPWSWAARTTRQRIAAAVKLEHRKWMSCSHCSLDSSWKDEDDEEEDDED